MQIYFCACEERRRERAQRGGHGSFVCLPTLLLSCRVVAEGKKKELGDFCGIPRVEYHDKYLGLPAALGRSKKDIFQHIEDRVKKKLKNWKRIDSLIANFWWGQRNSERRIHWCSWDVASDAKDLGGLGFRDFESFNRAFLAKQGWRMLTNNNSLLARCWKARYFPHKSFLDATTGFYPSFSWRSVMKGCQILKNGLCWTVRNGQSVRIWKDQWVPDTLFLTPPPQLGSILQENAVVRNLFNEEGTGWDNQLIFGNFPVDVARKISSIHVGQSAQEDCIRWKFTKDGIYSVKSGYWVAKKLKDALSSRPSSSSNSTAQWRWFRNLHLPPKIRLFAWKCMRQIIPTRMKLVNRGIDIVPLCPKCGISAETMEHALRDCQWANFFWNACPLRLVIQNQHLPTSIPTWILSTISGKPREFVDLFLCLLWSLWKARNLLIFQQRSTTHQECFQMAQKILLDYQEANKPTSRQTPTPQRQSLWKKPPPNCIKFNSDASIGKDGTTGVGGIFRNDVGFPVKLCSKFIPFCSDIEVAEALGCLHGVRLAREMEFTDLVVELDNQNLVSLLSHGTIPRTGVGTIVRDTLHCAEDFTRICFQWVVRECNTVAHHIANLARNPSFSCLSENSDVMFVRHLAMLDVTPSS